MNSFSMSGWVRTEPKALLTTNGAVQAEFIIGTKNARYAALSTFNCLCTGQIARHVIDKIHKEDFIYIFGFQESKISATNKKYYHKLVVTRFEHAIDQSCVVSLAMDDKPEDAVQELDLGQTPMLKEF